MPLNYGTPECPNTRPHSRMPGEEVCPRSDTYRMFENGTVNVVFGWTFRCRTCSTIFFRASREAGNEGLKAGRLDKLAREAQQRG